MPVVRPKDVRLAGLLQLMYSPDRIPSYIGMAFAAERKRAEVGRTVAWTASAS